jgi:hypothetical protein
MKPASKLALQNIYDDSDDDLFDFKTKKTQASSIKKIQRETDVFRKETPCKSVVPVSVQSNPYDSGEELNLQPKKTLKILLSEEESSQVAAQLTELTPHKPAKVALADLFSSPEIVCVSMKPRKIPPGLVITRT